MAGRDDRAVAPARLIGSPADVVTLPADLGGLLVLVPGADSPDGSVASQGVVKERNMLDSHGSDSR